MSQQICKTKAYISDERSSWKLPLFEYRRTSLKNRDSERNEFHLAVRWRVSVAGRGVSGFRGRSLQGGGGGAGGVHGGDLLRPFHRREEKSPSLRWMTGVLWGFSLSDERTGATSISSLCRFLSELIARFQWQVSVTFLPFLGLNHSLLIY